VSYDDEPMDSRTVLRAIDEPGTSTPDHWDDAMSTMPEASRMPFLDRVALARRVAEAGLAPDRVEPLSSMAATIAADPALTAWAWYLHHRVFALPEHGVPWGIPSLAGRLGTRAGLFFMLLSLEFAPRLRAYHAKLGYPSEVSTETIQQLGSYESNHQRGIGGPGMYPAQFAWLASYLVQPFVRLGRFEYQLHDYGGGVHVYRRAADGAVLALADDATRVNDAGLLVKNDAPPGIGWATRLEASADAVIGFPVDPRGRILKRDVRLSKADWRPCLERGDTVLDLHIPAGGSMDWTSMATSLRRASEFFPRHHANRPVRAVVVTTWFMDPRLADLVPAESNPLKLQRATYLYPTSPDPESLWFVFLRPVSSSPPASLPGDTSLQRSLRSFLEKGGIWHGGGFFLLAEHMADATEGRYREPFAALAGELGLAT
jgi:hypothetical protein